MLIESQVNYRSNILCQGHRDIYQRSKNSVQYDCIIPNLSTFKMSKIYAPPPPPSSYQVWWGWNLTIDNEGGRFTQAPGCQVFGPTRVVAHVSQLGLTDKKVPSVGHDVVAIFGVDLHIVLQPKHLAKRNSSKFNHNTFHFTFN